MERLLGNILKATGRESDADMEHADWPERKAVVDAERTFFLSDEWFPRSASRCAGTAAGVEAAHGSSVAAGPLPATAHPRLDDNGRPVRNMHADRSNRRLDLNDMAVGWEDIAEQVPLVGEKTAKAIIAYRQQRAVSDY